MEKKKVLLIGIIALVVIGIFAVGIGIYNKMDSNNKVQNNNQTKVVENVDENLVQDNVIINMDGIKENVSENVVSPVTIENFVLKDISLKYDNEEGLTNFEATVVNNSATNYNDGAMFKVYFYDDAENLMVTVPTTTSSLPSKGESYIHASITMDCTNASQIKVEIMK